MSLTHPNIDRVLEEGPIFSQAGDFRIGVLIRPKKNVPTIPRIATICSVAFVRAMARPLVRTEQIQADVGGMEVEDQTVVLLVDEKATLTVGQNLAISRCGHPVPSGEDVDAIVGTICKCGRAHGASWCEA